MAVKARAGLRTILGSTNETARLVHHFFLARTSSTLNHLRSTWPEFPTYSKISMLARGMESDPERAHYYHIKNEGFPLRLVMHNITREIPQLYD